MGVDPFAPSSATNLSVDLNVERKDADSWMRLTFGLPAGQILRPVARPRCAFCARYELWELGQFSDARLEFEDLRSAINADPY